MCRLKFQCRHRFASGFALDLEFEIGDGVTALFGPSGAGKSSTLAIVAGTLRPQQGLVKLNDRLLVDTARGLALPAERRQIGCVVCAGARRARSIFSAWWRCSNWVNCSHGTQGRLAAAKNSGRR
jgi:ABC-type molybdate transport system ATPase subunit